MTRVFVARLTLFELLFSCHAERSEASSREESEHSSMWTIFYSSHFLEDPSQKRLRMTSERINSKHRILTKPKRIKKAPSKAGAIKID